MNLLSIIKEKSKSSFPVEYYPALEAVIHHIEVASSHMDVATSHGDYYYTDAVYRANEAFDGALSLAYQVLVGKDSKKMTPHELSEFFEQNTVLKDTVLYQMMSYRDSWKHKVIHEHQLFFSSQEALLAIIAVSSFFNVLLDNILERVAHEYEKSELSKGSVSLADEIKNYDDLTLTQQVVEIFNKFSETIINDLKEHPTGFSECEVVGRLTGFIVSMDSDIAVETDKVIPMGVSSGRADLFLRKGDQEMIIELKSASNHPIRRAKEGREKIKNYMFASGIDNGMVFVVPINPNSSMKVSNDAFAMHGRTMNTVVIYPSTGAQMPSSNGVTAQQSSVAPVPPAAPQQPAAAATSTPPSPPVQTPTPSVASTPSQSPAASASSQPAAPLPPQPTAVS